MAEPGGRDSYAKFKEAEILRMREASGTVKSDDPIVSLLYLLARDELAVGKLEPIIDAASFKGEITFTNGWLATWAKDAATRLQRDHA